MARSGSAFQSGDGRAASLDLRNANMRESSLIESGESAFQLPRTKATLIGLEFLVRYASMG